MAHFYGTMNGARGTVTKAGTKNTGVTAHIRGWSVGVRATIVNVDGVDTVLVYRTGGSNATSADVLVLEFDADNVVSKV